MFQVPLGPQEFRPGEIRPAGKWVQCKGASVMGTPILGQFMSQDDEGHENFTELALQGKDEKLSTWAERTLSRWNSTRNGRKIQALSEHEKLPEVARLYRPSAWGSGRKTDIHSLELQFGWFKPLASLSQSPFFHLPSFPSSIPPFFVFHSILVFFSFYDFLLSTVTTESLLSTGPTLRTWGYRNETL